MILLLAIQFGVLQLSSKVCSKIHKNMKNSNRHVIEKHLDDRVVL